MKNNSFAVIVCGVCYAFFLSGCYPGNVPPAESAAGNNTPNSQSQASEDTSTAENTLLHINVSDAEIQKQDRQTACTGIRASAHKWNFDTVSEVFHFSQDEIENEEIIQLENGTEVYHVVLTDGGDLAAGNGFIYFMKNSFADKRTLFIDDFAEFKTPSLCLEAYPLESLDGFSKEEALQMAAHYTEGLSIPVDSEPLIYALDAERMNQKKAEYEQQHPDDEEFYPAMTQEDEAYRICFRIKIGDYPIMDSPLPLRDQESAVLDSYCNMIVTRSGLQWMELKNLVNVDDSEAEEISICNAQSALNTVVSNMEKAGVSSDTYIENLQFGYGLQADTGIENEFHLLPIWKVGSYSGSKVTENGETNIINIPVLHFVNTETGKER